MWQKYSEKIYLKKRKRRVAISTLVIFVLIPLTVYVGIHYWNDYNFMLVSVLILLYVMAPFFMMFERKKPRARELVLVAVMTALTALGNIVCYITIPFQAGTAMAIVSGIALGPEAGFLVGALAAFCAISFWDRGPGRRGRCSAGGFLDSLRGLSSIKMI